MAVDGVALANEVAARVVPVYRTLDGLSFAYGQGSLVAGFTADADLDLVVVWERAESPAVVARPAHSLNTGAQAPVQFHQPGFVLDCFWLGRQQVDVSHVPRTVFDGWLASVGAGGGWERHAYLQPLAAVAGFAYGVVLADDSGGGAAACARAAAFPPALANRSRALLAKHLPAYAEGLAGCARRGDGWLFHEILGGGLRAACVAWLPRTAAICRSTSGCTAGSSGSGWTRQSPTWSGNSGCRAQTWSASRSCLPPWPGASLSWPRPRRRRMLRRRCPGRAFLTLG